ncbi:endodeoxyribonuclease [Ophidiomyces ophidiicola]|nr:endodeoxyribonuclease [Ophidiomyces ophidiicola]
MAANCEDSSGCGDSGASREETVKFFVNSMLDNIINALSSPDGLPSVTLKRRPTYSHCVLDPGTRALQADEHIQDAIVTYSWPGKTARDAWRFGIIMRILGCVSEAIQQKFVTSKRDIYYLDPEYFGSQRIVDRYIEDIAYTIGVDRAALHVTAAAKGLTAGRYGIKFANGSLLNVGEHNEVVLVHYSCFQRPNGCQGILIPRTDDIVGFDLSGIRWVLVVEKEAVFHRLVTLNYYIFSSAGEGILITGKGYPDVSTRAFARLILNKIMSSNIDNSANPSMPSVPIHILVDGDPDGISIMSTYKYGSMARTHENSRLNIRYLEWLGLKISVEQICGSPDCCFIPLSFRDRKKSQTMLLNNPALSEEQEPEWRLELQRMLFLNTKAEIEILYDHSGSISRWLDQELKGEFFEGK